MEDSDPSEKKKAKEKKPTKIVIAPLKESQNIKNLTENEVIPPGTSDVIEKKIDVSIEKKSKDDNSDEPEEDTEDEEEEEDKEKDKEATKSSTTMEYDPANVHYEEDLAIYTDPKSGHQYQWCKESNEWKTRSNVNYGFEDDTHTYTDAEGTKYFWDVEKNAWFPKVDEDFMARYQMSYGFVDNTTPSEPKEEEKKEVPKKPDKKDGKRKAPAPEPSKC